MKLKFVVESKYYVGNCDILSGGTGPRGFFKNLNVVGQGAELEIRIRHEVTLKLRLKYTVEGKNNIRILLFLRV